MKGRTAIVYDWIDSWGGVERLLLVLREILPEAEWYTSFTDYEKAPWAGNIDIRTSWMQSLPGFIKKSRTMCAPIFPYAFESFNFGGYERVISVSSCYAKGVITRPGTRHISYILTPPRFLWTHKSDYSTHGMLEPVASYMMKNVRQWDFLSAQRPDQMLAISETVAERCRKIYKREAEVLYPPFDTDYWQGIKKNIKSERVIGSDSMSDYYLVVSRLESYKNIHLTIEACNALGLKLIIAGTGRQEKKLKETAPDNVTFMGNVPDDHLVRLYMSANALIMPQEEDFGYTSLEAQFFGCPVIGYKKGGVGETVDDGKTGILFNNQSVSSIKTALEKYHTISYNIQNITKKTGESSVSRYSIRNFRQALFNYLQIN